MTELEDLQAEAEALGVKVDGRWGAERLQTEIDLAEVEQAEAEQTAAMAEESARPDWMCVVEGCGWQRIPDAVICSGHEVSHFRDGTPRG
jgi:hypothetical protein